MISRSIYYNLKPILPWWFRVGARRIRAAVKARTHSDTWPISPGSAVPPESWLGWPGGKRFGLVLTHDVESEYGVSQAEKLADLESDYGFRSSFNFVPEAYQTPPEVRERLAQRGFEIGVHGLKHDGKLYRSREIFRSRAQRINEYLKQWGAVGFRSPFMHHNLEWIHDLEILYDASTFDTDPFEPQPDGVDTIFPFWVAKGGGNGGYIELPYTLVQDFTLFTVLQQRTIDLWKQKVDWLASKGGMVLLNLHPDYISFNDDEVPTGQFPNRLYRELLEYVRAKYPDEFWHGTARELATYCKGFQPKQRPVPPRHVCMVAYSHYESDNRITRYASALAQRGDHVEVISLSDSTPRPPRELYHGVWVRRIQGRVHNERGKWDYFRRLALFNIRAFFTLAWRQVLHPFDLIHVHNVPDFLVFSALIPRIFGAKIILDIHDIVPEFYESKFKSGPGSKVKRLLEWVEKAASTFAHHVIISNHLWYDKITQRSVPKERCSTYINYVDLDAFHPRIRKHHDRPFTVIFPGGFQWHQGLDVAIRAFELFVKQVPNAEFHIYGRGDQKEILQALIEELKLQKHVFIHSSVPMEQVPELLVEADLGVVPKRANSFGNEAYSTKIMEFMSQGLPAVVSRTKIDSFYFTDAEVKFFESENVQELAQAMIEVVKDAGLRKRLIANGYRYVSQNSWSRKKVEYLQLVDGLIHGSP